MASAQTHKFRRVFNPVHHWFGRFALVFAIINVYLGLHLSNVRPNPLRSVPHHRNCCCHLIQGRAASHKPALYKQNC